MALDHGQATSSLTLLLKAGSRYETKPGIARVLKNFVFKGTTERSALRLARESELYGGILSASLGREYLALTAEFLRGDEEHFVDVLSSVLSSSNLATHELRELVGPLVDAECNAASANPTIIAIDTAHSLAFRSGLGNPLFTTHRGDISVEDVRAFAAKAFTQDNVAVLGNGISSSVLTSHIQKGLSKLPGGATTARSTTKYFGGEARIESPSRPTLFIGFGTSSPLSALPVLAAYLEPTPSLKWTPGTSPLSKVPQGASVEIVHETYSDGALLGVLVQAPTIAAAKEAGTIAAKALRNLSSINKQELQKAISKAKFKAASALESRETTAVAIAPQVFTGKGDLVQSTLKELESIAESEVNKAARSLTSGKPTYVAIGSGALPYADELGL
ncbi:Metalloenzyme, LuxS/M16 peptidase-like protein [Cantharellus anzutake]|uniref:Metalloenzyme, LuxS/M16 peptidase-like protein n=1 Tax=Cantharellus anzutake TaxID=1750568 RepID=UPI0019048AE6|nr:Metalloenzyme, LuxS/M16 peptidase-like protein [Cantharellus anzutake]KAF8331843.1 Metalloenzyme, LuxS/M16 peptidase-like protein [Cantharellus anzutake]